MKMEYINTGKAISSRFETMLQRKSRLECMAYLSKSISLELENVELKTKLLTIQDMLDKMEPLSDETNRLIER